jgi:periplasmic mercuric ion binding protein
MKTIHLITVAIISVLLFVAGSANAQTKKAKTDAEVIFSIAIDCPSCQKKLESQVPYEKGIKDMKIDLENQTIWLLYSSDKTTKETLAKALEKLGYPAKEIVPEAPKK